MLPLSCLWQLEPGAGQSSPALKSLDLQQVMHMEGWLSTLQDDKGESQQGQYILQTVLTKRSLPHSLQPEHVDSCTSYKPAPPATHQFCWEALISFPTNSLFD